MIDWATGGNAYKAELYFVGTREFPGNTFGGRIDDVQDPQTGMIVTLRVFGDYSMQVKDPVALITNLVGTVDVANNEAITGWMSDQLLKVMRTHMTVQIVRNGWPILGLSAYTPDIEEEVMAKGNEQLATYGVAIIRMGNFDINLSEQDETQLKTLAKDTAYSRLAGSFQQYAAGEMALGAGQGMAQGGGGGRRGVPRRRAGRGWPGRGAGPARAASSARDPGSPAAEPASPAPQRRPASSARAAMPATRPGAKFCASCGTSLAPPAAACPSCQAENPAGRQVLRLVRDVRWRCRRPLHVVRGGAGARRPVLPVVWHRGRRPRGATSPPPAPAPGQ